MKTIATLILAIILTGCCTNQDEREMDGQQVLITG
jgi:uncharacterized protein YcfL